MHTSHEQQQSLKIPTVRMSNGLHMPALGLGTSKIETTEQDKLVEALKYAFSIGYRSVDTAWFYFNDSVLCKAIKCSLEEHQKSSFKLKREDLFICSKVWCTQHSKDACLKVVRDTLTKMELEYIDLFLIHWPMGLKEGCGSEPFPKDSHGKIQFSDVKYMETYRALEECVDRGQIKSIGLSNFNIEQCQDVINNSRIKPVCNQIEMHPYFQNDRLVNFCQNNNILVVGYAALGAVDLCTSCGGTPNVLEDETLRKIAKKHNKSVAQICLRWSFQRGCVPLVKAMERKQILEDGQIFDFELTDEDMHLIKGLNKNCRVYKGLEFKGHPFYPFEKEETCRE